MTTTTSPAAVSTLSQTCWQLLYPNGVQVDTGDSIPHFDTEAEARAEASRYTCTFGVPAPAQLADRCFVIRARCGYFLDEEGAVRMHHDTAEEAVEAALAHEWVQMPDGTFRCSPDCDDCAEAAA